MSFFSFSFNCFFFLRLTVFFYFVSAFPVIHYKFTWCSKASITYQFCFFFVMRDLHASTLLFVYVKGPDNSNWVLSKIVLEIIIYSSTLIF